MPTNDEIDEQAYYEAKAYHDEMARRHYEMMMEMEYQRNACQRCGNQREDWHNKLCGDEFCARCSMDMDQLIKEGE